MNNFTKNIMTNTANKFQTLAQLRGVSVSIDISDNCHYIANGDDCGPSVHGLYEWLERALLRGKQQ